MFGRALVGVLLLVIGALPLAPGRALAQDPQSASASGPSCPGSAADCTAPQPEPRVVPSAQTELVDGHADPSTAILIVFALASSAGLVVSVLNRLAMDESA